MAEQEQPTILVVDDVAPLSEEDLRPLYDLALLEADWSAHGSPRISPDAIAEAVRVVKRVAQSTGMRPDVIAPLGNGGVQLEWEGDETEIQVEVHPDRTFSFLRTGASPVERPYASLRETLDAVAETLAG